MLRWRHLDADKTSAGVGTVEGEGRVAMRAGNAWFDEDEFFPREWSNRILLETKSIGSKMRSLLGLRKTDVPIEGGKTNHHGMEEHVPIFGNRRWIGV